jgi:hypothetical protein
MRIKIVSRPPGGAPEHIRDQWVGIILPARPTDCPLADAVTLKRVSDRRGGYAVRWDYAMTALGAKSPEARTWWRICNATTHFPELIFSPECCEVVAD